MKKAIAALLALGVVANVALWSVNHAASKPVTPPARDQTLDISVPLPDLERPQKFDSNPMRLLPPHPEPEHEERPDRLALE